MAVDEKLQTVRHSCAHVMAEAVLRLFPGTKIAIGPAIENGFYYDFDFPQGTKFTETDFTAVEKEMRRILTTGAEFVRKEVSKEEALKLFADEPYKVELINWKLASSYETFYKLDEYGNRITKTTYTDNKFCIINLCVTNLKSKMIAFQLEILI